MVLDWVADATKETADHPLRISRKPRKTCMPPPDSRISTILAPDFKHLTRCKAKRENSTNILWAAREYESLDNSTTQEATVPVS